MSDWRGQNSCQEHQATPEINPSNNDKSILTMAEKEKRLNEMMQAVILAWRIDDRRTDHNPKSGVSFNCLCLFFSSSLSPLLVAEARDFDCLVLNLVMTYEGITPLMSHNSDILFCILKCTEHIYEVWPSIIHRVRVHSTCPLYKHCTLIYYPDTPE